MSKELTKKLIQMGLDEEKVLKILESHKKRIEQAKKYQKERYFKVSISVKKEEVYKMQEELNINEKLAKKLSALKKLTNDKELKQYLEKIGILLED